MTNNTIEVFSFEAFNPIRYTLKEFNDATYFIMGHFTFSVFLDDIKKKGLVPPVESNILSNDDQFTKGDEEYIYLAGTFDDIFGRNAAKRYGGKPIVIFSVVEKEKLEIDNLLNKFGDSVNLKDINLLHKELTKEFFSQCRTRSIIKPEYILSAYYVEDIFSLLPSSRGDYTNEPIPYIDFMEKCSDKLKNIWI